MRIINKKYLAIILLVGIILTGVIVGKPKERVKLDNVILKQEVNNKTFAMYKEDTENNYVLVEENKFPDMYVLNLTKSKCIDNNGNELDGVLSYENDKVTITSGNTTYCYLYFDKSLGLEIKEKNPSGLKAEKVRGAMYRFQGQYNENVQNYICFGTSNQQECKEHKDQYMYRIIGIEASTGRVKVIKKEALDKTYQWWEDYDTDVKWPNSFIFEAINNEDFLNNTSYIPTDWKEKIADNTWIYGDMLNDGNGAGQDIVGLYETESGEKLTRRLLVSSEEEGGTPFKVQWDGNDKYPQGTTLYSKIITDYWSDTVKAKISLIYLNDYSYSISDTASCNVYGIGEHTQCNLGWMNLSQNDSGAPSGYEWTIAREGWNDWYAAYLAFIVNDLGSTQHLNLTYSLSVRPAFYINASQELLSGIGTGTLDDPFIIK